MRCHDTEEYLFVFHSYELDEMQELMECKFWTLHDKSAHWYLMMWYVCLCSLKEIPCHVPHCMKMCRSSNSNQRRIKTCQVIPLLLMQYSYYYPKNTKKPSRLYNLQTKIQRRLQSNAFCENAWLGKIVFFPLSVTWIVCFPLNSDRSS